MTDFIKSLVQMIVNHPEEVIVEERVIGENIAQYIITTNPEDTGKVIGKEGKIIQAIRNVAKILAIKENKQIRIEIGESVIKP